MILLYVLSAILVFRNSNAASIDGYKSYKNYRIYNVEGNTHEISRFMGNIRESIETSYYNVGSSEALFLLAPEAVEKFEDFARAAELDFIVVEEDFSKIIELEKSAEQYSYGFSWKAYYDIDKIYEYLLSTSKTHPDWVQLLNIGKSYENRDLLGVRINTPGNKTEKPVVFIESGIHAREWIAPATTTYFINQLLTSNNPKIINLRDQFDWRIFPSVNPDGYQYSRDKDRMWRQTRSKVSARCYGADPNRNWDYNWMKNGASSDPCNRELYAGSKPFSEVETKSLSEYVRGIKNLLAYVGFHADAQCLLLPFSDQINHDDVDNYKDLVQIGKTAIAYGQKVNGEKYKGPGTAPEIIKYAASGGSMDWVRYALKTPLVFTFELRGVMFTWPPERIPEQGEEYTQMMIGLFEEAKKLGYY